MGNLTRDPEKKYTPSGVSVTTFSLAVNRDWTDKDGNKKQDTTYVNVVAWQKLADICAEYLCKGSNCYVEGRINTRSYEAQDGSKRYVTEVIVQSVQFLSKPKAQQEAKPEQGLGELPLDPRPDQGNPPF